MDKKTGFHFDFQNMLIRNFHFLSENMDGRVNAILAYFHNSLFAILHRLHVHTNDFLLIVHADQNYAAARIGEGRYFIGKTVSMRHLSFELDCRVFAGVDFFN